VWVAALPALQELSLSCAFIEKGGGFIWSIFSDVIGWISGRVISSLAFEGISRIVSLLPLEGVPRILVIISVVLRTGVSWFLPLLVRVIFSSVFILFETEFCLPHGLL